MNNTYLIHHGIKNQKWGDRNGPPYPLSASAHSSAEKAAGTKGWTAEAKKNNTTSYSVGYTKRKSYLQNQDGEKISRRERRALIREAKKDDSVKKEYKHLNKQVKRAKRASHAGYYLTDDVVNNLIVASVRKNGRATRALAEERVNEFLVEYGNKKLSEI